MEGQQVVGKSPTKKNKPCLAKPNNNSHNQRGTTSSESDLPTIYTTSACLHLLNIFRLRELQLWRRRKQTKPQDRRNQRRERHFQLPLPALGSKIHFEPEPQQDIQIRKAEEVPATCIPRRAACHHHRPPEYNTQPLKLSHIYR
jgi:hypothetical protein